MGVADPDAMKRGQYVTAACFDRAAAGASVNMSRMPAPLTRHQS